MQCGVAPAGRYSARNVGGARALERIVQPGGRHEITEPGALAADVEVPAYHGARSGLVHDVSEHGELGAVQRIIPVRHGPVTVMVGHRMRVDHAQLRPGQPGHQGTFQAGLERDARVTPGTRGGRPKRRNAVPDTGRRENVTRPPAGPNGPGQ